jgi:hypothetical protein
MATCPLSFRVFALQSSFSLFVPRWRGWREATGVDSYPFSLHLEPFLSPEPYFFGEFNLKNGENDHILRDPT